MEAEDHKFKVILSRVISSLPASRVGEQGSVWGWEGREQNVSGNRYRIQANQLSFYWCRNLLGDLEMVLATQAALPNRSVTHTESVPVPVRCLTISFIVFFATFLFSFKTLALCDF